MKIPVLGEQSKKRTCDYEFYVRLTELHSYWNWYIAEYDTVTHTAYGYTQGYEKQWGYFDTKIVESLGAVRVTIFDTPISFKEIKEDEHRHRTLYH